MKLLIAALVLFIVEVVMFIALLSIIAALMFGPGSHAISAYGRCGSLKTIVGQFVICGFIP